MSDTDNEQPKHVPRAERTTKLRVFTDWHLVDRFRHLFSLREDADEASTVQDITRAIEFRGANLWALIFAILLASVGLNINSAAVIIGAMLISPLMGPIMGVGLALGTNDLMLFKRSLRNLLVAVSISVMTSTIYFLLTPLGQAQSELLARTRPTVFDVLIAICGGSIGIIASSRREKSNAIPGVAIATALMPPLCTAGYGLANANWNFFFGALYLFFINSVFICISTVVVVRYLKFAKVSFVEATQERRVRNWLALFGILTLIPSVFMAWEVVQESLFQNRSSRFLAENFNFRDTQLIKSEMLYDRSEPVIRLLLLGEPLTAREQQMLSSRLPLYQLQGARLVFQQPRTGSESLQKEFDSLNQSLRVDIVEDLYKKNIEALQQKDIEVLKLREQLALLQKQLENSGREPFPTAQIAAELKLEFPLVKALALAKITRYQDGKPQAVPVALVRWSKPAPAAQVNRLRALLRIRLQQPQLELLSE